MCQKVSYTTNHKRYIWRRPALASDSVGQLSPGADHTNRNRGQVDDARGARLEQMTMAGKRQICPAGYCKADEAVTNSQYFFGWDEKGIGRRSQSGQRNYDVSQ